MFRNRLLATAAMVLPLVLLSTAALRAEDAGITGAVNTDVAGTPPGGSTSNLTVGRTVVRNEHIVSNDEGLAQLLFLDQTTLTVGPNSDIMIDEFVYDPATKEGQLLMEASVGVFRLIGGEAATSGGINVTTPFASMGIRGSNIIIQIAPNGTTRVTCNYCESVEIRLINDPDQLVTIFGTDRFRTIEIGPDGFSAPFELTPEEIALLQTLLTSPPGKNGGVANIPSEPQVSEVVNGDGNSNSPPPTNDPKSDTPVEQGYKDQLIPKPKEETEGAQDKNEEELPDDAEITTDFSGRLITAPGLVTLGEGDEGWSGDINDPNHTQAIVGATRVGDRIRLQLANGSIFELPFQTGDFSVSDGSSPDDTLEGSGFVSPSETFFAYLVEEVEAGRLNLLFGGNALPDQELFKPIMAWDLRDDPLGGQVSFLSPQMTQGFAPGEIVETPLYFVSSSSSGETHFGQYGVAALGFSGTGRDQQSVLMVSTFQGDLFDEGNSAPTITGGVRAFSSHPNLNGDNANETRIANGDLAAIGDGDDNVFFGGEDGVYFVLGADKWRSGSNTDVVYEGSTVDGGESTIGNEPIHVATPSQQPLPTGFGDDRANYVRTGYAAGAADLGEGGGNLLLRGEAEMELSGTDSTMSFDLQRENDDTLAPSTDYDTVHLDFDDATYIDRSRVMMQEGTAGFDEGSASAEAGALVSWELVRNATNTLPGGATPCTCAFMEWGFWAYDVRDGTNVAVVPIGTWVTGEVATELPDDGSASYEGHAIANIVSVVDGESANYMASGSFALNADFGSREVAGTINNLDGRNYSFSGDMSESSFEAQGSSTTGSPVDIELDGSFFAGPVVDHQGVGGGFDLRNETFDPDNNYRGAGTFMGEIVPD